MSVYNFIWTIIRGENVLGLAILVNTVKIMFAIVSLEYYEHCFGGENISNTEAIKYKH